MSVALIMRGVPGSGKSSFNSVLTEFVNNAGLTLKIHSTDDKFMVHGKYEFDQKKLGLYHTINKKEFKDSLDSDINIISVDNTNIRQREYNPYVNAARARGAYVMAVVFYPDDPIKHFDRNSHGVPLEVIESMINKFSNNNETIGVDKELIIYPEKFSNQKLRDVAKKIVDAAINTKMSI